MNNNEILEKWKLLISACKSYYIDSEPTGMSDSEYDLLESRAILEDGFNVRDYVFRTYTIGTRTKNNWIERIKKEKVTGSMISAITEADTGGAKYYMLKYDGSSLAIYLDPKNGKPLRIVTCGNLNLEDLGIDQTAKLYKFLPSRFPKGIVAIQAEALVDTGRMGDLDPERARQKSNGLINSKYSEDEVNHYLTLRAFRYYTDDSEEGRKLRATDFREVLRSFKTVSSHVDGHIMFSPAETWTLPELLRFPGYTETDNTMTESGTFLNDGWVCYDSYGKCLKALKFSGAGTGSEGVIKTKVIGIQWNDQSEKGKDSWSANVLIDPVTIKGCTIRKPSAGSVSKLVKNDISFGASVSVILANSTIPMIGETFEPGNGDFDWPVCSCGYCMDSKDIYGSNLKCGNKECTVRASRMKKSLGDGLDLDRLLVIDRFKWSDTDIDLNVLLGFVDSSDPDGYRDYLFGYVKTELQKRILSLVWELSFKVLYENRQH